MGLATITAARIYKGQKNKNLGEEQFLAFEKFPYVSLVKTYALDKQVADSANTATAYLCGVKANFGTLGVNGRVKFEDCQASKDVSNHVTSILEWAQNAGKSTGFITTTRVTHASPAALYSHSASRDWESFSDDPDCPDIALQLVTSRPGKDIQVILGGGRKTFLNSTKGREDGRKDGRDLIEEWMNDKINRKLKAAYVSNLRQFNDFRERSADYLLGLFNEDHLNYVTDLEEGEPRREPTLEEMTKKSIEILKRNPKGFFLFIEGGRIDTAHHTNNALKALEETLQMDKAIETALHMTSEEDTLMIVTADHSHTMTINGYPKRGNNILGIADVSDLDNLTYTTLLYSNGPGWKAREINLTSEETSDKEYQQNSAFLASAETHGGEDVTVHAIGPMAHLFQGIQEQSYIPHALSYAACIGPNLHYCQSSAFSFKPNYLLFPSLIIIFYHNIH
ncbi:alkaline phosphatase, tissue-nonspecific isozyme-like isoform X2 [Centruroides sculpturatus]|nr:alkaline phosphatase, tissue-nonspecific isozyme-like isoform X2 [Centruroides sculpturatus]